MAEEEETLVSEEETSPPPADAVPDQTVSVPVSPSDVLTMLFQVFSFSLSLKIVYEVFDELSEWNLFWNVQAEGTMVDSAVPVITKALEVLH